MINILNDLIPAASISIPKYQLSLHNLINKYNIRLDMSSDKAVNNTQGQQLFKHIFSYVFDFYIEKDDSSNDIELYIHDIEPNHDNIKGAYDTIQEGRIFHKTFVKSDGKLAELITPITTTHPITDLPIGESYEAWVDIPVFRILYANTVELPVYTNDMLLHFSSKKDNFVLFGLDTSALLLKYINFLRIRTDDQLNDIFMRNVYKPIYKDLFNNFIMNIIINCIDYQDADLVYMDISISQPNQLIVTDGLLNGLKDLIHTIKLVINNNKSINSFMNTPLFYDGDTLFDLIYDRVHYGIINTNRPYSIMRFFNSYHFIYIYLSLVNNMVNKKQYSGVVKNINKSLRKITRTNPTKYISDPLLKKSMTIKIKLIETLIQTILK